MIWIPAAIGGVLGALGGIFGQRQEHKQQERNIQDQLAADKELAQYAYSQDLDQWHRQNEYNAPTAQMARLRDAGLNPKMIYGTGSAAAVGQSGQSPKYQSVRTDFSKRQAPLQAMGVLGAFQDFLMKNAQIDLVNSQAKTKRAEAEFANPYYWARMRGTKANFNRLQLGNLFEMASPGDKWEHTVDGRTMPMGKSFGMQRRIAELSRTQFQSQQYEVGNKLKALELEWYELLKKMGIGSQLGVPLLKLLFR